MGKKTRERSGRREVKVKRWEARWKGKIGRSFARTPSKKEEEEEEEVL